MATSWLSTICPTFHIGSPTLYAALRAAAALRSASSAPTRTRFCFRLPGRPFSMASKNVITRPDLADRAIFLTLPYVHDTRRRPEREIWQEFESARPLILGALLEAASHGLRTLSGGLPEPAAAHG